MQSIDIFLLASLHEGSANVLLEAMACSKPVVAFEVSSISEIVENNYTGYLAEFKNIENFSEYVQRLIEDSELRQKMGHNGKNRIKEKFNVTRTMPQLLSIIE
jgi:glycosyltransferase involved in cell wall biosynthesis